MKITVFTSNQPRHLNLIKKLSLFSEQVYAVQECNTVFPGLVKDFFNNSDVMRTYFEKVMQSEKNIFNDIGFLPENVSQLAIKLGDLNKLSLNTLKPALSSDLYVVFGSSFIKGELMDFLKEKKAINIHMGVSPYFRGSSCNFWAPYTGHPELVGATIHMLSSTLDAGDMLYHALPKPEETDLFDLGMKAVKVAHDSLAERVRTGEIFEFDAVKQDRDKEIKYTINKDFTDDVAKDYLNNLPSPKQVYEKMKKRDMSMLLRPYIG